MGHGGSLDRDVLQGVASGAVVAAGLIVTVPAFQRWLIFGMTIRYVSTATAGNRRISVELRDDVDAILAIFVAAADQVASQTVSHDFGVGVGPTSIQGVGANLALNAGFPSRIVALPGYDLRLFDPGGADILDTATFIVHAEAERAA